MPLQNPPALQANDGARGELEVLINFVFMLVVSLRFARLLFANEPDFTCSGLVYYFVSVFLVLLCMYVSEAWVSFHWGREFSPVF